MKSQELSIIGWKTNNQLNRATGMGCIYTGVLGILIAKTLFVPEHNVATQIIICLTLLCFGAAILGKEENKNHYANQQMNRKLTSFTWSRFINKKIILTTVDNFSNKIISNMTQHEFSQLKSYLSKTQRLLKTIVDKPQVIDQNIRFNEVKISNDAASKDFLALRVFAWNCKI